MHFQMIKNKQHSAARLRFLRSTLFQIVILSSVLISFIGCSSTNPEIELYNQLVSMADSLQKEGAIEYYLNGTIHEEAGEMYRAVIQYQLAHIYDPNSVEIILSLAKTYLKLGEHRAAAILLGQGRESNAENEELLVALLQSNVYSGQYPQAVKLFEELKRLRPLGENELKQFALVLTKLNRFDESLELYNSIIKEFGEQSWVLDKIAQIYLMRRDVETAKKTFYKILDLEPDNHNVIFLLGSIEMNDKNFEEAEKLFRSAMNIEPGEIKYWANLMGALDLQKEDAELLEVTSEAVSKFPESAFFMEMHGNVLTTLERYEEASNALRQSILIDSTRLSPYQSLGYLYHHQKDWGKSAEIYNAALKLDPGNPLILNNYAYMLSSQNDRLKDALEMVENALKLEPDNPTFLDTRGWVFYQLGQYEKALTDILEASEGEGENVEIYEHLAHVHEALGNLDKAKEIWRKAYVLDPENEDYKRLAR